MSTNIQSGSLVQIRRNSTAVPLPHAPAPTSFHLFETELGAHVMLVNGSRVFTISSEIAAALEGSEGDAAQLLAELGLSAPEYITGAPLTDSPIRSLSLAIAQKCNLGCTYCYAQEGGFGAQEKNMSAEAARAAVDMLLSEAAAGDSFNLAFLGGEPLTNRKLLRECTERAVALAQTKHARISFSITTNGTLLTPEDGEFFERHGFAVTVSLDGVGEVHDRTRPFKSGRGSYDRVLANVRSLLAMQQRMQVSARVTVTPANLFLRETLDEFLSLGFHSVGFSPMLSSPTGAGEMGKAEMDVMLAQMISCGEEFERRVARGERYSFLNMTNAMRELHKGTHRPYPCGAGAGYLGVSADGGLYACHRFVEDPAGAMGDVKSGVDVARQARWLAERHVHMQEPCRNCWARYMCGGGCHHEVIHRGRPACDYIRGWLHYCLQAYIRLLERRPEFFYA
ncbi:MAG: SPASM domain-containing protein [Pyrinomonadaceae bacterium]|nr:SPASM domain-containing protein [Pyrinomonadaceae bacterium]